MRYNVKLTKIHADHNKLRDDEIIGWANDLPTPGQPFVMVAPPKDPEVQGFRFVNTSPVMHLVYTADHGEITSVSFATESGSQYRVEIIHAELIH